MEKKVLKQDFEFENAKSKGTLVEVMQGTIRIYPAGKITAFSTDTVALDGKKILRSVNEFIVVE